MKVTEIPIRELSEWWHTCIENYSAVKKKKDWVEKNIYSQYFKLKKEAIKFCILINVCVLLSAYIHMYICFCI